MFYNTKIKKYLCFFCCLKKNNNKNNLISIISHTCIIKIRDNLFKYISLLIIFDAK